ncbi:lantibiotic dehydratase C-terminal domain-containing protein [Priestia megaterium]
MKKKFFWRSYHIFYHENLDFIIKNCIEPIINILKHESLVDKFFFY